MVKDVEELREEFESLVVNYVTKVIGRELTLEELKSRRGDDGNYWQHSLANSMWIGYLLSKLGLDRVLLHMKCATVH